MKKNFYKTTALLIAMGFASAASAADPVAVDENGINYRISSDAAYVTVCPQQLESVDIREMITYGDKDYPVVGIDERAFFNNEMTSVSIPETVTSIGKSAFYGCKGLTELVIPNSVTSLGEYAFEKCLSVEKVSISSSLAEIPEGAFFDWYALKSVSVPSSVKYISKSAFSGCHALESVSLPASLDSIGSYVFYMCDALKTVTIPSGVKSIGGSTFWNCASLESITLSPAMSRIESKTFYGCKALTSIVLPSELTVIGDAAFEQCMSLPFIVIPPTVSAIEDDAFKNCEQLSTIVSYPTVPPTIGRNVFYRVPSDAVVYVPAGTLDVYPVAEGWNALKDFRELGSVLLTISETQLTMREGESVALTVDVDKAVDVEIVSETWWTSDPLVAVVDDGKVTAVGQGLATICFTVVDGVGCPHVAVCEVYVDGVAGVEGVESEEAFGEVVEYYNLNGVRVNPESLAPGLYIRKEGKECKKIMVR